MNIEELTEKTKLELEIKRLNIELNAHKKTIDKLLKKIKELEVNSDASTGS